MKQIIALSLLTLSVFGQDLTPIPSEGSGGGTVPAGVVTTNFYSGRTFYVATNGNDATAVINDASHPFAGNFSYSSGVMTKATNSGDVVYALAGTYIVTNFTLENGVLLTGPPFVWPPSAVFSNLQNITSLAGMIRAKDNCRIQNIYWIGQNTFNGPSNYTSLFWEDTGLTWTNVLISNVKLIGSSDVFVATPTLPGTEIRDSEIYSHWDLSALGSKITSRNCYWKWLGDASSGSAGAIVPARLTGVTDYGSTFDNVGGFTNSLAAEISGAFYGSVFKNMRSDVTFPLNSANFAAAAGSYYSWQDAGTFYSDYWIPFTNSITTNIVITRDITNLFMVYSASNGVTGGYTVSNAVGNTTTGVWTYTNRSANGFTVRFNDPAMVTQAGGTPIITIHNASGGEIMESYDPLGQLGVSTNHWYGPDGGASLNAVGNFGTNSISTNYVNSYVQTHVGNGSGLTNINASSFRAINSPANGYALRYTNGNLYWAP